MQHIIRHILHLTTCLVINLCPLYANVQTEETDAIIRELTEEYSYTFDDEHRLKILDSIAKTHVHVDSTLKYAQLEMNLAETLEASLEYANAMRYIAWSYYNKRSFTEATPYLLRAIDIYEELNSLDNLAAAYSDIANTLAALNQYTEADRYYHSALKIYTDRKKTEEISHTYRLMGHSCIDNNMLYQAKNHFINAMIIDKTANDKASLIDDYYYLGMYNHKSYEGNIVDSLFLAAKRYYRTSINLAYELERYEQMMRCYISIADLMLLKCYYNIDSSTDNCQFNSIQNYLDSASILCHQYGFTSDSIEIEMDKTLMYTLKRDFKKSKAMLDAIEECAYNAGIDDSYFTLGLNYIYSIYYELQGNHKKALQCYKEYSFLQESSNDDLFAIESTQSLIQIDYDRKFQKHMTAYHSKQQTNRILMLLFLVIIVALLTIAVIIWRTLKKRNSLYSELDQKNHALEQQKEEIQSQNEYLMRQKQEMARQHKELENIQKQTTESIHYALHIQQAAIPSENLISKMFGESFILFKPLNIVSGDFYWAYQKGHYRVLAVADSTGHGIPGAFMSMLGISILNNVCSTLDITSDTAADILNTMRDDLKQSLRQSKKEGSNNDGIDIALIILDIDNMTLQYAGAFRPLWILREDKIIEYKGDRMPIGIHIMEKNTFTNNVIQLRHDDSIFMFSDGITDQFGYENGETKKFTAKRLREFLIKHNSIPMNVQKLALSKCINDWTTSYNIDIESAPQTDDILLVGIHIN